VLPLCFDSFRRPLPQGLFPKYSLHRTFDNFIIIVAFKNFVGKSERNETMTNELPVIGVPLGDPSGIGPEIAIKAALSQTVQSKANVLLIGPRDVFMHAQKHFSLSLDSLDIHYVDGSGTGIFTYGKIQANCGKSAFDSIREAASLAMAGRIDAVATTPINKESLRAAKIDTIGHTELLAEFTGSKDLITLFQTNSLRVFFLTRHLSLVDACKAITYERVLQGIRDTYRSMQLLGIQDEIRPDGSASERPFAVAGLNPHNGEHGLFGDEEGVVIAPAVKKAIQEGIPVTGPIPADSVFYQARTGRYSAVLSLYHDQGHIATKTYDFERTISLTLGMPFLRTSVDHGTAFDIAGKNIAQFVSMEQAILIAAEYAATYKKNFPAFIA
jgi:4-hydroxythreonine-4-phosphate dehydrogenase